MMNVEGMDGMDGALQAERAVEELVKRVHADMCAMRDQWVRHRAQSGVEARWRKAKVLYEGAQARAEAAFLETLRVGAARRMPEQQRSRLVVNIVRPKADQAIARVCEVLLPTDGKNWGLKATPIPEAISARVGDVRPTMVPGTSAPTGLTAHQEASAYLKAVEEARAGMERAIDDSLQEGSYNAEQRKVIEDGVRFGTGVLFGPLPSAQYASQWNFVAGGLQKVQSRRIAPRSFRHDLWDVWFDPACGNDHRRGQGVWTLKRATRSEVRALADAPGFSPERVRGILAGKPTRVTVAEGRVTRSVCSEDTYELWTYYGAVEPEQMALASFGSNGDPLADVDYGVVVMCQDEVIGAMPYWMDEKTLPCDVWCWRKSDESPYGYGLPDELEHQQAAVIAAWRQVMDNGRNTSGAQIVVGDGIEPANGSMEITPNKIWRAGRDVQDVTRAFAVYNFDAHLNELMAIADAAMKFADYETGLPQLLGGDKGQAAPETLGGMVMLFSNATAVLRYRCKLYDDHITAPHIARYFDWHMQFNPDEAIKGDMEIVPIGASALLERDIQNQGALNMVNVTSLPRFERFIDAKKELKVVLKAMRQKPEDIMLSDEEIAQAESQAQQAPPAPDPQAQRAEASMQAKQMELQDRDKQRQFEAGRQQQELALKRETLAYERQREQGEYEIAMTQAGMARDTTLVKLEQGQRLAHEALASKERLATLHIDNERQLFNAEAALRTSTGAGI